MSENFDKLLGFCQRINPASLTGGYEDRKRSVTKFGVDLALPYVVPVKSCIYPMVLMLGCGDGYEVDYAASMGWDSFGLTWNPEEISLSSPRVSAGDIHNIPFDDSRFSATYSKETLEHSPCPFLALVELNRVTKPGGKFFHLIADGWNKQRDWYHFSCLPDWLWCDLFRKAGFEVEQVIGYPNVERCTFENKAYVGRKVLERRLTDGVASYKQQLQFGEFT